uniref:Neurochondrin n=1 Tax=Cyprinus carpio TaxID=7962 RepID=A0A8C2KZ03_CYPCA
MAENGWCSSDPSGLSPSQREVLERCLHALNHAKNDSHILAALLLITRLCPAGQLDTGTLHQIFEAVGFNLPARLLVTAFRGGDSSRLPPEELISLGTALLAALSTDASMVAHPQLLSTALACDCYQVLNAVCALPQGPEQLLTRGAVLALCRAVFKKQTLSHEKGLPLLGHLLSSSIRPRAWARHSSDLLSLLGTISQNFCRASDLDRLEMCSQIPPFLPPPGVESESQELKEIVGNLWASLRPLIQGKLGQEHLGLVLVVSACLLDLYGWESTGPPKFCCLLVNRACVEVRMGLEEPPGTEISPQLQHTLTACYRIMEAAMEQACSQGAVSNPAQMQTAITGLSLQQSRQVLGALEEAFSAEIYYLKHVRIFEETSYDDPFLFATFRSLCAWLAEETSCLKEDVIDLLPFLIGYAKSHYKGGGESKGLADWMLKMSISNSSKDGTWSREAALRYLLPALCHLSAEDGPRRVLLSLDTPAMLVDFLSKGWSSLRGQSGKTVTRDPSLETACSALLNFAITEPERVRNDPCFIALETMLSEALPALLHKPRLLVLAANCCTLGLMIARLKSTTTELGQRRFFSSVLSFLLSAVQSGQASKPARISALWEEHWEEAGELWRLSLQALGGCVRAQPWITTLIRDEGWLQNIFTLLGSSGRLPDQPSQDALEEVLCAIAKQCPVCRKDISELVKSVSCGSLQGLPKLSTILVE